MKIANPNYVDPLKAKIDALAGKVETYFASNPAKGRVTLKELRAALPADAASITPGMMQEVCKAKGWGVVEPESDE